MHGFQTVAQVRHGTFEDYVRGVIQEPVLVHATEVVYGCRVEAVHGFIVGMAFFLALAVLKSRRLLFRRSFFRVFSLLGYKGTAFWRE